jgi:hypothetical protein
MNEFEINDKRSEAEFKGITFSKYQKTKVKKILQESLADSKIEASCYWSAELICSGHLSDLWEIITIFFSKNIHLGNPCLPTYIEKRFADFKNIVTTGYVGNELALRNNPKIRKLFAEIISVLCFSDRKPIIEPIKIKNSDEFNIANISAKLKAPSVNYAVGNIREEDSKELFIPVNEFAYHISKESANIVMCCYWLEWIMEYENICKKKKVPCAFARRSIATIQEKYQNESIWIIWEVILNESKSKHNILLTRVINALLAMYSIRYTSGVKKRRRHIIYFAISLLTENPQLKKDIIPNKNVVMEIVKKIDTIYKDIKKNEEKPETDYLYMGVNKSSVDKTAERLEKMNQIMRLNGASGEKKNIIIK